jgi:hypothetical protein
VLVLNVVTSSPVAAVIGYIAGIFTEPIKLWFQKRAGIKQMEAALYKEMASNYESLKSAVVASKKLKAGHSMHVNDIQRNHSAFDRIKTEYLSVQIPSFDSIEWIYRNFRSFAGKGSEVQHCEFSVRVRDAG